MDAFIGEIRAFPFNFVPKGWLLCDGTILYLSNSPYNPLFNIIGTTYGGDGMSTMGLPNIKGRTCLCAVNTFSFYLGMMSGEQKVVLNQHTMPEHNHVLSGATVSGAGLMTKLTNQPAEGSYLSNAVVKTGATSGQPSMAYSNNDAPDTQLTNSAVSNVGSNQAHNNMQPSLVMRYFICYEGIFPSRS